MGGFVYDRLLEDSLDEHASACVRLADGVAVERDFRWTAFRLRNGARWHDGRPVTREDVLYTLAVAANNLLRSKMCATMLDGAWR